MIRVDLKIKVRKVYFAAVGQNEKDNIGASDKHQNPLLCIHGVKQLSYQIKNIYLFPHLFMRYKLFPVC